ncbi:response regulator receiver protein [Calothrix sp. NIES-4071]|nr:response regulator receiver protein [Calothrix sp. NIES-4071]BAZ56448.1 response regulator receiver protein [Calothrix sp. NIES-4105]
MSTVHTILLVEDDPNEIYLTRRAFQKANINVSLQIIDDGDSAIAYLSGTGEYADRQRFPIPKLILLDLKLPCRSGHEILAWLRQHPNLSLLPVVIFTSSREPADVNLAYELGANSYLVKPSGLKALKRVVETLSLYWLVDNEPPEVLSVEC